MSLGSKVTKNGQVSLPAELRHRWGVGSVLFVDRGTHALVVPYPDDPIRSLRGKFAGPTGSPTTDELRAEFRREEAEAEERRASAMGRLGDDEHEDER